jgi:hypothetical protein
MASAINTTGEANRVLVALYGNAARPHGLAVTDTGEVYLVATPADRARIQARGLTIRAERKAAR